MTCEKHKLSPVKGYSDCPGCEVEWLRDRAEKAEQLAKRLADDALTSLAGIVCTPVEGYLLAPQCLASDIRNLRKLEEAATKRAISAEKGWQEAIETLEGEKEAYRLSDQIATARMQTAEARAVELLETVKLAYRKHHMDDLAIGWEELDTKLFNTLCNVMGDGNFNKWLESV